MLSLSMPLRISFFINGDDNVVWKRAISETQRKSCRRKIHSDIWVPEVRRSNMIEAGAVRRYRCNAGGVLLSIALPDWARSESVEIQGSRRLLVAVVALIIQHPSAIQEFPVV